MYIYIANNVKANSLKTTSLLDWIGYMYKTQITDSSDNKTSVHRENKIIFIFHISSC